MCAEHIARPFEEVCATLLHEMVHLDNVCKGIKDTSRGSTYHNKKFKISAEEHGLVVNKDEKYGWTLTSLNEEAKRFVKTLDNSAFAIYREEKPLLKSRGSSSKKYVCPRCGMIVRATKEVNVVCGDCMVALEEE